MKKRLLSVLMLMVLLVSTYPVTASSYVTMYSLDGRTITVSSADVEAYKQVGWYNGRPTTIYALDGRTIIVGSAEVGAYKQVGWYNGKPTTMYSLDGRAIIVGSEEVEAYKQVGWYNGKPTTMYSLDGRVITVGSAEVEAYKKVGWYNGKPTTMYALDGRAITVGSSEVEAYKKVGWYTTPPKVSLPISEPIEMCFSSGVGAWQTTLTIYPDGSFVGAHHDSDMGDTGPGYPYGTIYICDFSGKFNNIQKINDYSYSMTLSELKCVQPVNKSWIANKVRYIGSPPHGIDEGKNFIFYTPNAPVKAMSEDFLSWWPGRWGNVKYTTLRSYGLYNINNGCGFFGEFDY